MMQSLVLSMVLLGANPTQEFTVVNKTTPRFTVVNKCPKSQPVAPVQSQPARSGCGCTVSANCGAGFCKSHGGPGCPVSCPVKAAFQAPPVVQQVVQQSAPATFAQPLSITSGTGGCANGQCSSGATGWYPGKFLGRR